LREEKVETAVKTTKEVTSTIKVEKAAAQIPTKDEYNSFFEG
jgi:hypothetical protein